MKSPARIRVAFETGSENGSRNVADAPAAKGEFTKSRRFMFFFRLGTGLVNLQWMAIGRAVELTCPRYFSSQSSNAKTTEAIGSIRIVTTKNFVRKKNASCDGNRLIERHFKI